MCAHCKTRKAWQVITVRFVAILLCDTCMAELFRAGMVNRQGQVISYAR